MTDITPDKATLKIAAQLNVKHRKFVFADEAQFRSRWDDALMARKVRALNEFAAVVNRNGIEEDNDGGFYVVDEAGNTWHGRYTRKGEPTLRLDAEVV